MDAPPPTKVMAGALGIPELRSPAAINFQSKPKGKSNRIERYFG
jgi:hypothetical protein